MTRTNVGPPRPEDDPYEDVIANLSAIRQGLEDIDTNLSRQQDAVGTLRVRAYQKPTAPPGTPQEAVDAVINALERLPDEATLEEMALASLDALGGYTIRPTEELLTSVARVLAPEATEPESDPYYTTQAKAAILVARGGHPASVLLSHLGGGEERSRQSRTWDAADALWAKVAAGEVIDRAQAARPYSWQYADQQRAPERQCADTRHDSRGDCDGILLRSRLNKPMNGLPIGEEVTLCRSHHVQAFNAREVGPGMTLPPAEEIILREGVVVRSGDTLVLSYPAGTPARTMLDDKRVLLGQLPEEAQVTIVTGAQVSVIRHPED